MAGLVAAGALATPAGALATSVPGTLGLQLLDAPVAGRGDPRAQLYIVDHLPPGATIRRRVKLTNTTAASARVALYAGDAAIGRGAFLGAAGRGRGELSTWTSVAPRVARLRAGGSAIATVRIRVPADAAPGERYGIAWAEVRAASGTGITQVSRVGIRLYVSIGPGAAPAADFAIDAVSAARSADGRPMVVATVRNTGGRALDMNGTVALARGPGGLSAGPFAAQLGTTLAIGATERVTTPLDRRMPAGPWTARVGLRSGLLERRASARITFPVPGASSGPPWLALAGAFGALVAVVVLLLRLVRRLRFRAPASDVSRT